MNFFHLPESEGIHNCMETVSIQAAWGPPVTPPTASPRQAQQEQQPQHPKPEKEPWRWCLENRAAFLVLSDFLLGLLVVFLLTCLARAREM